VPYWLVSTRHPDKLAAAIESARRAADWPPDDGRPIDRQPIDRQPIDRQQGDRRPGDWESVG
jgi:hypothetical protein